jgi:spermidine synthase
MSNENTAKTSHSLPFIIFLIATALMCGALVMVIEVLGSRVIGPFFGASLFVWTSLITVTLVALALGYTAGGVLSDRYESPVGLYMIIFLAGLAVHLIPFLKKPVFEITLPLGLRVGALSASALLFGLPLFFLGCVSPYIIKIAAREMRNIGRTVGLFYAVSTFGSFIGTVCTGFILIAYFPVNRIFAFVGWGLIVLAAIFFVFFRKRIFALLVLAIPFLLPGAATVRSMTLADGMTVTNIHDSDTFYGNIKVLDTRYRFPEFQVRDMLVDGAVQGGIDLNNGMPVHDYYYYLQYIPYSLNPGGKSCLVMGLGAGIIPLWYEKRGIRTDVVDISPQIFTVAEKYFGFHASGETVAEDARFFLNRSQKKYDYIILDVFNGDVLPEHVLSLESFEMISRHLNDNGILGMNVVGSVKNDTFLTASMIKTLHQVFTTVQIYPTFDPDNPYSQNSGIGNLEVFAYNFPPVTLNRTQLQSLPFHPLAASARNTIGVLFSFPPETPGMVLTDNYNPIDSLELGIKEEVRRRLLAGANIEMLL